MASCMRFADVASAKRAASGRRIWGRHLVARLGTTRSDQRRPRITNKKRGTVFLSLDNQFRAFQLLAQSQVVSMQQLDLARRGIGLRSASSVGRAPNRLARANSLASRNTGARDAGTHPTLHSLRTGPLRPANDASRHRRVAAAVLPRRLPHPGVGAPSRRRRVSRQLPPELCVLA